MRLEPASAPRAVPDLHATPEARRRREQVQWQGRQRLERQLHDGAALRVSALVLQLGLFRHRVPSAERDLRDAIDSVQEELHAVLQELRAVAAQIYPPLLDEAGLGPALRELADELDVRLHIIERAPAEQAGNGGGPADSDDTGGVTSVAGTASRRGPGARFGAAAEGAVYFAVVDWLSASPSLGPVDILITRQEGDLVVVVRGPADMMGILAELFADRARPLGGIVTCAPDAGSLPAAEVNGSVPISSEPAGAVSNGVPLPTVSAGPVDAIRPDQLIDTGLTDAGSIGTGPVNPAVPTGTIVGRIPCE